jgi:serine protease Do
VNIIITKNATDVEQRRSFPFGFFGTPFEEDGLEEPDTTDETPVQIGAGSGFVVSSDGMILTNRHVVGEENATYTVVFQDGKEYPATVLARDTLTDLAVLKIDATNIKALELGNSDDLKQGQSVIAIGNTLGEYQNTVTKGIVSGLSRSLGGEYTGLIQTDAAINQGNSGGPLLNSAGQVVGINTAVDRAGEGIGFAIPINEAKIVIESVKKDGKIVRPALGVRYIQITPALAKANDLKYEYGAYIRGEGLSSGVLPGSAAEKAGLQEGDIILEVNGMQVTEAASLPSVIRTKSIGDIVRVKYARGSDEKEIDVTLTELPATEEDE